MGWKVAEKVRSCIEIQEEYRNLPDCEIDCLSVGGLALMERMVGYDCAILIDSMQTENASPGSVVSLNLNDIPNRAWGHLSSSHDTTLHNALEMGYQMDAYLPDTIWVVGIEARQVFEFSENLTPEVSNAIPKAVHKVIERLSSIKIQTSNMSS